MRSALAAVFVLATLSFKAGAIQPIPSLGEPALSPDRFEIVFVSGGDIWSVPSKGGEAHLLVSHPATESRPLFSPDGKKLAFASNRTGNGDIYVLTFTTGQLSRITFSDSPEVLDGWSHDGKWLYFSSAGNDLASANDIFRVSAEGGTPLEVSRDRFFNEFRAAPSPDGSQIAFVAKGISAAQWWRHGHSHLDESEIWIKQIAASGAYHCIVEEDAKQGWPMWSSNGQSLFYTSDRSGAENVYVQAAHAKATSTAVTHFKDGRLLWPSISYDGREIVFERNFTIWKLDTKSGASSKVPITLRGAVSSPETAYSSLTQFSDMALSPDGKKVAVIAHGDVFAASATDGGDALRITQTASPEATLRWAPDSNRIIYLSARNGHDQIFEYDFTKNAEHQVTSMDQDDASPVFSPDGRSLAFVRAERDLHVLTLEGNRDRTVASGSLMSPVLTWSPDSRFIAYTSVGAKSFRNVNAVSIEQPKPQPISFLANGGTATQIAWSPDGRYLVFDTTQRSEPSQMARVELIPHLPRFREDQFRELFRTNTQPDPDRTPARQPDREPAKPGNLNAPEADSGTSSLAHEAHRDKKPEATRIVFEGLRERLSFIPLGFDSRQPVISPDGKLLLFEATTGNQQNLYSYSLDELSSTPATAHQLTSTSAPKSRYQFTPDSKQIYFLDGGRVTSMPVETHVPKTIDITARLELDFEREKMAAFNQGWSLLNRRFFDSDFNGKNWSELHDEYEPYVAGARTPDEMRRVMNLMIGELNASHSGINPPPSSPNGPPATPFSPAPTPVGHLGLRFERETYEAGEGLVIREVIPLGPASLEGTIKPGETLLAVNGEAVTPKTNLDSLLEGKVDRRLVLQIGSASRPPQKREAVVRPVSLSTEKGLIYRDWVKSNRAYVDRISGGKLGYVHIQDMSAQSLTQLYIDLDAQNQTKEGVVVDVRDNNGGFVNQYALDVLTRKNYLIMTPRNGSPAPARPFLGQRSLGLPTILVTNQGSLSDAEDFTEGYHSLKLGRVVGEPTAGWIIYTSNRPLIDGSSIRIPDIRVQAANGQTMEMHPRPVDVFVERRAGDNLNGSDAQLDRAVKELLAQLSHPSSL